jgi:oxaloacetate decarboxylase alpha subunit
MQNGNPNIGPPPLARELGVEALRKKYPNMSDEERLLRQAYAGTQVDDMLAAGPIKTEYEFEKPLVRLLKEITSRPKLARVYIENKDMLLELKS